MPAEDPTQKLALAALDAESAINALRDGDASGRMSFSELFAYVNDPAFIVPGDFDARLKSTPQAQENLLRLMQKAAIISMPRLAAAATDGPVRREVEGAVLTLMTSKADADQLYLIIELTRTLPRLPKHIVVLSDAFGPRRLALPEFSDERAQIIIGAESEMALALMAPETEVFLI